MAEVIPLQSRATLEDSLTKYRRQVAEYGPGWTAAFILKIAGELPIETARMMAGLIMQDVPTDTIRDFDEFAPPADTARLITAFLSSGPDTAGGSAWVMSKALPDAERNVVLIELLRRYCLVQKAA